MNNKEYIKRRITSNITRILLLEKQGFLNFKEHLGDHEDTNKAIAFIDELLFSMEKVCELILD